MSLLRKIATFSGLFILGDVTSQKIAQYQKTKQITHDIDHDKLAFTTAWSVGIGGPAVCWWYKYLDGNFKKSSIGTYLSKFGPVSGKMKLPRGVILGKIAADLLFDIPLYASYVYSHQVYDKKIQYPLTQPMSYVQPFKQDFVPKFGNIYALDLCFWTPANVINFFYVGSEKRILFVSGATFAWSCLLPIVSRDAH